MTDSAYTLTGFVLGAAAFLLLGMRWKHFRIAAHDVQTQRKKLWTFRRIFWVHTIVGLARATMICALIIWLTIAWVRTEAVSTGTEPKDRATTITVKPRKTPASRGPIKIEKPKTIRPYTPKTFG